MPLRCCCVAELDVALGEVVMGFPHAWVVIEAGMEGFDSGLPLLDGFAGPTKIEPGLSILRVIA